MQILVDGSEITRSRPWYAAHSYVKTAAAAREARAVADRISSSDVETKEEFDDRSLFVAMHACAYRASAEGGGRMLSSAERQEWMTRRQEIRGFITGKSLGLARLMTMRFMRSDGDYEDLFSEALLGLLRAVDRFDPWRGYRFSTYACNVIIRALMRSCKRRATYQQRFPTFSVDISDCTEMKDSSEKTSLYLERLRRVVDKNAGGLTEIESRVLGARFPAHDGPTPTYREVGKLIGLSKERIRQIQVAALHKLRAALDADPVLRG